MWNKIITSRQYLPHGACHCIDSFYAVKNLIIIINKDNIAVLTHKFNDEVLRAHITKLIEVFQFNIYYPLEIRLSNRYNPGVIQMLPKQHCECRCHLWTNLILISQIAQGQRWVSR